MNVFRLGRGELFGIIIPGAFFLLNIYRFFPVEDLGIDLKAVLEGGHEGLVITAALVLSYILGFSLRLIKPDILEKITCLIRFPYIIAVALYAWIVESQKFWPVFRLRFELYWQTFPYIDWFYDNYLQNSPNSFGAFYKHVLVKEFDGNRGRMKGQVYVNQCKLHVRNESMNLGEELMFREGLVRFLAGMSCALFFSALILALYAPMCHFLVRLYGILFILFILKLRHIRLREVSAILSAYAFVKEKAMDASE